VASPAVAERPATVEQETIDRVAKVLRSGEPSALLVGGAAVHEQGLRAASRVARATGAKLLCETFPTRLERGAGLPAVERLGYLVPDDCKVHGLAAGADDAVGALEALADIVAGGEQPLVQEAARPDRPTG